MDFHEPSVTLFKYSNILKRIVIYSLEFILGFMFTDLAVFQCSIV